MLADDGIHYFTGKVCEDTPNFVREIVGSCDGAVDINFEESKDLDLLPGVGHQDSEKTISEHFNFP